MENIGIIQPIWKIYQQTKDIDTLREEIKACLLAWADRQGNGWNVNTSMFLIKQFIDDWRNC